MRVSLRSDFASFFIWKIVAPRNPRGTYRTLLESAMSWMQELSFSSDFEGIGNFVCSTAGKKVECFPRDDITRLQRMRNEWAVQSETTSLGVAPTLRGDTAMHMTIETLLPCTPQRLFRSESTEPNDLSPWPVCRQSIAHKVTKFKELEEGDLSSTQNFSDLPDSISTTSPYAAESYCNSEESIGCLRVEEERSCLDEIFTVSVELNHATTISDPEWLATLSKWLSEAILRSVRCEKPHPTDDALLGWACRRAVRIRF